MHNVTRLSAAARAAKRKENEERAASYRARSLAVMERKASRTYDSASLDAVTRVVTENPDFATMWNFRREVLKHLHPDEADASPEQVCAARQAACATEFALTQECLGINPKSYPVWHHRQWVLEWGRCSWQWPVELKLTGKLLTLDDRNFHCWTYRRFVVEVAGISAEQELQFTTSKIEANFSNYSAWHYRSKLLPAIHAGAVGSLSSVLRAELELVRNAFFTAPEDSSAWFYHRWLIAQLAPGAAGAVPASEYAALLEGELAMVDELLELEPDCKWPLATAAFLSHQLAESGQSTGCYSMALQAEGGGTSTSERFRLLQQVDALRERYYLDAAAGGVDASAASPPGDWQLQRGGYYAPLKPEMGASAQAAAGGVGAKGVLPSFIQSSFTTKVEYEAWRQSVERA